MQAELWVKIGAPENEIQFNTLDRAMNRSEPGMVIRLMPGKHELTVALNPDVAIKGLGKDTIIVDSRDQLEGAAVQFITIIKSDGTKKLVRPKVDDHNDAMDDFFKKQRELEAIKKIMGKSNYPGYVCNYKFRFGKYKGKNAEYVLNEDPSYLKWLYNNTEVDRELAMIITNYADKVGL